MKGLEIMDVAHHRNGVGGTPIRVVLFHDPEISKNMVAIQMHDGEEDGKEVYGGKWCMTGVLSLSRLAAGDIKFGSNSWRGDDYQDRIAAALEKRGEG